MTLDKTKKYVGRFGDKDTNSPTGSYKNKTDSSTNDGSFLEQDWANDWYDGLSGAFLANVHDASTGKPAGYVEPTTFPVTLNETVDNAQSSQVYNAWYKKTSDVVDAKIAELITLSEGCWFNWYSGGNSTTDVIVPDGDDYESVNFTANANTPSPIYLGNNISVNTKDSTVLNFAKAGTYFFKPTLYLNERFTSAGTIKLLISKPSDNETFNPYFNALSLKYFSTWSYSNQATTSTKMYPYRSGNIFNVGDPKTSDAGNWFENLFHYGSITPSLFVVINEDNSQVKIDIKEPDLTGGYNMSLEFQRVGGATLSSPYMAPTDLIVDP